MARLVLAASPLPLTGNPMSQIPSWTAEGLHLSPEVAGNLAVSRVESGGQLGSVVTESCGPIRDGRVFPALYNWDRTTYFIGMCITHDLGQGH